MTVPRAHPLCNHMIEMWTHQIPNTRHVVYIFSLTYTCQPSQPGPSDRSRHNHVHTDQTNRREGKCRGRAKTGGQNKKKWKMNVSHALLSLFLSVLYTHTLCLRFAHSAYCSSSALSLFLSLGYFYFHRRCKSPTSVDVPCHHPFNRTTPLCTAWSRTASPAKMRTISYAAPVAW